MITTKVLLIKLMEFEGLRLKAYKDTAGVPTIGYGHTHNVRMGDQITSWYAKDLLSEDLLSEDIAYFESKVKELNVARTEGQLDALVSFAFNLGVDRLKESTLLKIIREGGNKSQIKREFKRWVYADGKKLKGLERRREWEAKRFFE